ncbi:hypothetical protein [Vibrio fluminensis]|uniref:hypothetical protein n=1 Tax=Vibrio fluminensis TaxID=2783614 RepID=UPI001886ED38|nr:hypothetical protein [Vibrio fluminensis]
MSDLQSLDLSEQELTKRLNQETFNHPLTLVSAVSALLGSTAAALFSMSDWFGLMVSIAVAGAVVCTGFVLSRMLFTKHIAIMSIIEQVRQETQLKREQIDDSVRKELAEFQEDKAIFQLNQLKEKFTTFSRVLDLQFDSDEMAHKRYLTTAEQLYFGAVDNLRGYVVLRHSINAINVAHIKTQLNDSELETSLRQALVERLDIYTDAQKQMADVLAFNEQVMTKIDDVTSRLGAIQTREATGEVRLETAMQEIQVLINRAQKYDISN